MPENIYVKETWINATGKPCCYGDSDIYETWAELDQVGKLYRAEMKEYGRCIGKIYTDLKNGKTVGPCGWVFLKREKYTDCNKFYLLETWVKLYQKQSDGSFTPLVIK